MENYVPSFCTAGGRRPRRAAVLQKVCTSSTARAAAPERLSRAQPSPPHLSQPWQPSCAQVLRIDFVLLHAHGPERHACLSKHDRPRDAAADGCKQAEERPRDGCRCVEARGAAGGAPKRRRSGRAGRFACRGARRARKAVRKLLARMQRARWMHARLICLSAAMVPRVHRL